MSVTVVRSVVVLVITLEPCRGQQISSSIISIKALCAFDRAGLSGPISLLA